MRTLEEIDKDILYAIDAVAKLADERDQISPNPFKVKLVDKGSVQTAFTMPTHP